LVSPPKVNYFVNLPSDSDESDDKFDSYTIFCSNNSIENCLPHSRTLEHFESSTNILRVWILELEKIISIYQSNIGELERTKNELSMCKGENVI
jgi:hypothetical protein